MAGAIAVLDADSNRLGMYDKIDAECLQIIADMIDIRPAID